MSEWLLMLGSALWFGVLTSISPCPFATNVAAVSYLGKQVSRPSQSMMMGMWYSLGRMASYVLLASLLLFSALSAPKLSNFLQSQMNLFLGPVLLLVGLLLLGVINLPLPNVGLSDTLKQKLVAKGQLGAFALGALFALSFCPTSAALFFASLLPLVMQQDSALILPAVYGFGTALPVFVIAVMLAAGTLQVSKLFAQIGRFELWARRLSGVIFVAAGLYYLWFYLVPTLG